MLRTNALLILLALSPSALCAQTTGATAPVTIKRPITMTRPVMERIVVGEPIAALTLAATPATLEQGQALQVVATPTGATGAALTGRAITWTSSNPAVVAVDATGTVSGVEVGGPVTITATAEGKSASATFSVSPIRLTGGTGATSYANASSYTTSVPPGGMTSLRSFFSSTGDVDRFFRVVVIWPQNAACSANGTRQAAFSVRLSGIPAGRDYDLSQLGPAAQLIQESRNPGNQDESLTITSLCSQSSSDFVVRVHRTSGLPSSSPYTLTLSHVQ